MRLDLWNHFQGSFEPLERRRLVRRPIDLKGEGIGAVFHYVPLRESPAGRRCGRANGDLIVTNDLSSRLMRLPIWVGLQEAYQNSVVDALTCILTSRA